MYSLPPPDLGGPLPLQINRLGHAVHGLCKNGTVSMANGLQQDGYAFPGTGFCYAVSVPGFVASADPDAATEQAAGRYWLPYAIVSGGQLYGQQLMNEPGYRGDAAVFMSFGTNRNLAITIPGGAFKAIWWSIWPSQQVHKVSGIREIMEIPYWRLLDVAGHRAVFAASTTIAGYDVGKRLWYAECRFFELTVSWPAGGAPAFTFAELPNSSSIPTKYDGFSLPAPSRPASDQPHLEITSRTYPAFDTAGATSGMTYNGIPLTPAASDIAVYYPHDHTSSRIVGYAYRDDIATPIVCEARSVLTQDYQCSVESYDDAGNIHSIRLKNKVRRVVNRRVTFGGVEVVSAAWDQFLWDGWEVTSDGWNPDHDANALPLVGGGEIPGANSANVWMGCYLMGRGLLMALWSETNTMARWQVVDIVTGQKYNDGSMTNDELQKFLNGLGSDFAYASKHPVTGAVAVSVPAAGSSLVEQLCWV